MGYVTRAEGAQTPRRISDGLGVVGVCILGRARGPSSALRPYYRPPI